MGAVERFDRGSLRSPKATPQGFLRAEMYATRTGVFEYPKADGGVVREYRAPAEVFHADSLASYQDASFTDDHPAGMVTAENVTQFERGTVTAAGVPDGVHVRAPVVVKDKATIAKMQAGKQEVSCGYTCDLVWESGVSPEGVTYDARQTNIRINHVALVDVGRAGPSARVRMDGAGVLVTGAHHRADDGEGAQTMKFSINGVTHDVTDEVAQAIKQERDAFKADADAKLAAVTKERDTAAGELRTVTNKLDAAEKAAPANLDALVKARVALVVVAERHGIKADGLSDRAVKVAVVEKLDGDKLEDARSDDYVSACFDRCIKAADKAGESLGAARVAVTGATVTDAAPPMTADQAHAAMVERNRNDWKPKEI